MNKKILLVVVLLIALGLGAVYFFGNKKMGPADQGEKPLSVGKKEIPINELPKGFPFDMPVPAGSEITQNYESTASDGRLQSTRVITTQQSADSILTLYKTYFTKLGWVDFSKKGELIGLMRRKDDTLMIAVANGPTYRTVEITLSKAAPQK